MAVGYAGFAQIYNDTTPVTLLTTGCTINPELNPIASQAAVGYGWKNAADMSHYANGVMDYRGNINFDMQGGLVWNTLGLWALQERIWPKAFAHSPDGTRSYSYGLEVAPEDLKTEANQYGAWCDSFSLSTGTDSTVQATVGVLALSRVETTSGLGYSDNITGIVAGDCNVFNLTDPLNPPSNINTSPIPFWKTKARVLKSVDDSEIDALAETVSWDVSLTNNAQIIKTCNMTANSFNYGTASAVVMGPMSVTGNIELYKHSGVWDPVIGAEPIIGYTTKFVVTIDGATTDMILTLPAIRLESDDYTMNVSAPVMRKFGIKGLGGVCSGGVIIAPMTMNVLP